MIDKAAMNPTDAYDPKDPRTQQRAKLWATRRQGLAGEIAKLMNGSPTAEDKSAEWEREQWWFRDDSVDPNALYASGAPVEVVAAKMFPARLPMMMAAGRRDDPEAQYQYVQRMTKLGKPKAMREAEMAAATSSPTPASAETMGIPPITTPTMADPMAAAAPAPPTPDPTMTATPSEEGLF